MALTVIVLACSFVLLLVAFLLDLAGIRQRGVGFRWQGAGLLVMNSAALASSFGRYRGWSYARLDTLYLITGPVTTAGFVLFAVGLFIFFRARRKEQRAN